MGKFIQIPKDGSGELMTYSASLEVDVTKPLTMGIYLEHEDQPKTWYQVSYEKLPAFCLLCGILGHGEAKCPNRYADNLRTSKRSCLTECG